MDVHIDVYNYLHLAVSFLDTRLENKMLVCVFILAFPVIHTQWLQIQNVVISLAFAFNTVTVIILSFSLFLSLSL